LLRHSNPDLTVGTYIHGVPAENLKAQELYVTAMMKKQTPPQASAEELVKAKPVSASIQ